MLLVVGAFLVLVLLLGLVTMATGSGMPVSLPLSYPPGGWQSVCANASINGISFSGDGPAVVGARPMTSVTGASASMSVCVLHATDGQRALAYLNSAPGTLFGLVVFALVAWLLIIARRKGPFVPQVYQMLSCIGWFVIAGSVAVSVTQAAAGSYFLASAMTVPVPVRDDILSALYAAVLGVPVLAGIAVLTLARVMRAGALMRDDLEGTV